MADGCFYDEDVSSIQKIFTQNFLEHYTKQLSSPRRYDFFRTIRSIACVRGKWEDWEPFLRGSWEWPRGVGRHGKMTP